MSPLDDLAARVTACLTLTKGSAMPVRLVVRDYPQRETALGLLRGRHGAANVEVVVDTIEWARLVGIRERWK
jgi:hypothetical protein